MTSELACRVTDCVNVWRVHVERTTDTGSSVLAFGRTEGRPVVLKVIKHPGEEWGSGATLEAFEGRGTVRVYEHTPGAMLLERAVPGHPLAATVDQVRDNDATGILARVISAISSGRVPTGTPSVQDWGRAFERYAASGDVQIPRQLVTEAQLLYSDLCASQADVRLLHGDLHHGNVLFDVRRGWLAIDPKGVIGELEYEAGAALRNPWELPELVTRPATIRARVERFARELPVDPNRVLGWACSQAVLAAIWTIEDGLDAGARVGPLALATAIQPLLSKKRREAANLW